MATAAVGALAAFALAVMTTPTGVSGAVFLLPVQVSLLGVPSPAVTPTNLLYNVLATPGGLLRYARAGRLRGTLARTLLLGTLPGVVVGAVLRVEVLDGPRAFLAVVAAVLAPLGAWLVLGRPGVARRTAVDGRLLVPLALAVGVIGGVYGLGGGSLLAPILLLLGYPVAELAGPALLSTLVTSVAGIATFELLALHGAAGAAIGPEWGVGLAVGLGGLVGGYCGARLQPRVPEAALRRLLGVLAMVIALRYVWVVATG